MSETPQVLEVLRGEAGETRQTPFGLVGTVFSGEGIELVWVAKQSGQIDPDWFSSETVDLLLVVQGRLRVEFADERHDPRALGPSQLLVLPANTCCRAYRWPREAHEATIFVAAYPKRPNTESQRARAR